MSTQPRVAVVGVGAWGRNHVRNFEALAALAMVCDSSQSSLDAISQQMPGIRTTMKYSDVLEDTEIQAVVVATPPMSHGTLVLRALDAGKHVLVEKPLSLDLAEAEQMRGQAENLGRTLMVGHLLLYHPAFRAVKGLLDSGGIGKLQYIYSNRLSLGKVRREENALWSFAPHDVSMILSLTGEMPGSVFASGGHYLSRDVADTTLSHLTFREGLQAHIFVSWLHPYKEHRLVVVGEQGMVAFDDGRGGDEKVLLYRHGLGWDGGIPVVSRAEAEPVLYSDAEPLLLECQAFLECIRHGTQPRSDAEEGIRVLRVLDACQRAMSGGMRVSL